MPSYSLRQHDDLRRLLNQTSESTQQCTPRPLLAIKMIARFGEHRLRQNELVRCREQVREADKIRLGKGLRHIGRANPIGIFETDAQENKQLGVNENSAPSKYVRLWRDTAAHGPASLILRTLPEASSTSICLKM